MFLSPELDITFHQITEDGFTITRKIKFLLSSETLAGIGKTTELGEIGCADYLAGLKNEIYQR